MKHFLLIFFTVLLHVKGLPLFAQISPSVSDSIQPATASHLLRIYEDNDLFNIRGKITDDAYTAGTRIDYFYNPNTYGWGIMQLIFTPDDISNPGYQPDDYPWSGGLIATHTLYSYNPSKKFDFQTEMVLGVIGPAALARPTQDLIHTMENYFHPMGWGHQFQNDLLLNFNFTAEKQLASWGPAVEIIAGGQVFTGTMKNGIALYPMIRIGRMTPFFQGYLSQYTNRGNRQNRRHARKWQAYFIIRPEGQLVLTNAMLEGGVLTGNPNTRKNKSATRPYHALRPLVYALNYGGVVSSGNFSISFNQNSSSAMMKGLYSHEVGNISLYFGW
jgi:lipid A 3-O-deacylase